MQIKCPKCGAELELTVEVLSAAEGLIRCADCDTAFNALALIPDPTGGDQGALPVAPPKPATPESKPKPDIKPEPDPGDTPLPAPRSADETGNALASSDPDPVSDTALDHTTAVSERDALPMDDLFEDAPETLHPGDGPPLQIGAEEEITRSGHWWVVATLVLAVTLGFQLVIASTGALARHPATRPVAEFLCSVFACEMPQSADLTSISLLNRDIRKHPSVAGGLMITATMSNQATHRQPFPMVEIQLADLNGRPVALRRFEPREYLAADTDISAGMPIDVLVPMSFEVLDPGDQAVAFEFRFR